MRSYQQRFSRFITMLASLVLISFNAYSQLGTRNEIKIPDILGYKTLKADLHMHTIFSDGDVWPTVRIKELWKEGLDVYSITDHLEYQPHEADIPTNHNRPYEIALPMAESLRLSGIKGSEISRGIPPPPGHFNAIFIDDANPLDTEIFYDSMKAAADQGAFIFWNHPGYGQPGAKSIWYDEQTEVLERGYLHGIEVVNDVEYYPLAHQWCLDKKLTMLGNSDVHPSISFGYDYENGAHRPMTLVFAKKQTNASIKDALFARRTAVWMNDILIGEEQYLRPIFNESIDILTTDMTITGDGTAIIQICNSSDIPFKLVATAENEFINAPKNITLHADRTIAFTIKSKSKEFYGKKKISLPYIVSNLYVLPNEGLPEELSITVEFVPIEEDK